jgi:predicted ATP-dependent serine protease
VEAEDKIRLEVLLAVLELQVKVLLEEMDFLVVA